MREIVHIQAGQCGNQIGAKVIIVFAVRSPFSCQTWRTPLHRRSSPFRVIQNYISYSKFFENIYTVLLPCSIP